MISQGCDYYEAALKDAARAGENATPNDDPFECEEIMYSSDHAYQKVTGEEMPVKYGESAYPPQPLGERWNEDDLPKLFPELCRRFEWGN